MLSVLRITNLAIIEECEIEFREGLNVLTGETGAGKSIILKSIELLTGARASADIIRAGADKCIIEGLFRLRPETLDLLGELVEEFEELGSDDEILIRRVIDRSGRSKIYLNGSLITAQVLQQVGLRLIDLTGQHQQQSLLEESRHLQLLDQFGVEEELREEAAERYTAYARAAREYDLFQKDSRERLLRYERLKEELEELNEANLRPGEREEIEAELVRLSNFEHLTEQVQSCLELLEESEESVDRKLRLLGAILDQAARLDQELEEARQLVDSAAVQLSEAKLFLARYGAQLDGDPSRLEQLRERIAEIARLERKYQLPVAELCDYRDRIAEEVAHMEGGALDEQKLKERRDELRAQLTLVEARLTEARKRCAAQLSTLIEAGLGELNMKRARFEVEVQPADSGPTGADAIRFMIAANPGEPFRPIARVASGGELSRILLVLKTVLNDRHRPETQIFDEIDSGVGGAVAQAVGEKLHRVAAMAQVIVVSHSPQVAACADAQFLISKSSSERHTRTQVQLLDHEARISEIAQMLAGKEVTSNFEQSARELIEQSRVIPSPKRKRSQKSLVRG